MFDFNIVIVIVISFLFYLVIVLAIGLVAWRRTQNADDYFLGGRTLSPTVSAISAGASDMSSWVLLGLPGYAYVAGLESAWIAIGLVVGVALNWFVTAKRLRRYSAKLDALTIPGYLHKRFFAPNPALKLVSSFFILLFFLFYVSSGLIGGGKLFEAVFGLNYQVSVVIGAAVILFYTLFGGFLAVSWTDVFQGLLMLLALILVPIMVYVSISSDAGVLSTIQAKNPDYLSLFHSTSGEALGFIAIISLLGWGLGYFGQPHILARFQAIRSEDAVPQAAVTGSVWALLSYGLSVLIGLVGIAWFDTAVDDSEKIFIYLTTALFHPVVAGILLAAILAAIMSTADSQLLVCSSALAEDLYPVFKKSQSTENTLKIARVSVAVMAVLSLLLALDPDSSVLDVVAYAWAGLGASIGPVILLSLYWRRTTYVGAIAGVMMGGCTVIVWGNLSGGIWDIYELVPAFIIAGIAAIAVSAVTLPPTDGQLKQLES